MRLVTGMGNGRIITLRAKFRPKDNIPTAGDQVYGNFITTLKNLNRQGPITTDAPTDYGNGIMKTGQY
jgi:hypothetical protein